MCQELFNFTEGIQTMKTFITHSISLNILDSLFETRTNSFSLDNLEVSNISVHPVTIEKAQDFLDCFRPESAMGHADTAAVVSSILNRDVPCNRAPLFLTDKDVVLVAQYRGERLPEGATTLPDGAAIEFVLVGGQKAVRDVLEVLAAFHAACQPAEGTHTDCFFCGSHYVIPKGHSYGECPDCGSV